MPWFDSPLRQGRRMPAFRWRWWLLAAPLGIMASAWALVLGAEWSGLQPWGSVIVHKLAEAGFLGAGVLPLLALALIASEWARVLGIRVLSALGVVALGLAWFVVAIPIHRDLRHSAVPRVEANARPVVAAIDAFTRRTGRPPMSLAELVPADLSAIPATGLGAFPAFEYERLAPGHPFAETDDPWRLPVAARCGHASGRASPYFLFA